METIKEAKEYLKENFLKGTKCPCCGRRVKAQPRGLYATTVNGLIRLYRAGGEHEFKHTPTLFQGNNLNLDGGDFAKLKHWGLIEEMPNTDSKKRTSGYWKITKKGVDFIQGRLRVPHRKFFYNTRVVAIEDPKLEMIDVRQALGKHFDYEELMRA